MHLTSCSQAVSSCRRSAHAQPSKCGGGVFPRADKRGRCHLTTSRRKVSDVFPPKTATRVPSGIGAAKMWLPSGGGSLAIGHPLLQGRDAGTEDSKRCTETMNSASMSLARAAAISQTWQPSVVDSQEDAIRTKSFATVISGRPPEDWGISVAIRSVLKRLIERGARLVATQAGQVGRDGRNVDLCLAAALEEPGVLTKIRYPGAYVEFLRTCIEPMVCSVQDVRNETGENDTGSKRFSTLVDVLKSDVPPIAFATAQSIALVADRYRTLSDSVEYGEWAGDLGLLFSISSSFGKKGRILSSIVRFARSERCLELGTAYGMSALFLLSALKAQGGTGHLATLEGLEPQFSLAGATLKDQHGDMVSCHLGMTQEVLPELARSLGRVDFLFHDAGHSRDDYVRDFRAVIDVLSPGGVVLIDDIRWEDPRFSAGPADAYRGWREIVGHARVRRAVEIDHSLGLLLLR